MLQPRIIFSLIGLLAIILFILIIFWWSSSSLRFLNAKNGNIITLHKIGDITFFSSEKKSHISDLLIGLSPKDQDAFILIGKRTHWSKYYNIVGAKCYTELYELHLHNMQQNKRTELNEVMSIFLKYDNLFLNKLP